MLPIRCQRRRRARSHHAAVVVETAKCCIIVASKRKSDKSRLGGRLLSSCNLYEILAPAVGIEPTTN